VAIREADDRLPSWQAMDSGRLLLLAAVGMMVVAAVAHTAAARLTEPQTAIAFGSVIAIGELLRLRQQGGREAAPVATAAALAYALLLRVGELPGSQPVPHVAALQVITVTAVGMTVGALPHMAAGRPAGLTGMATRLVAVACVAFAFRPIAGTEIISGPGHWWIAFMVMTVLVVIGWLAEAMIASLIRADDLGARFSVALWDEMRIQLPLGAAVGVSAMMITFAAEVMGLAGLAVFMGPLLVTQVAFRRYAGISATYLQTVRALARVTEVGGYVESGHSRRVSRLAVAVGRELGLGLSAQAEGAADPLHVDADHARAFLALGERRDRHPREVAHRPLGAVAHGRRDLRAQRVELVVGQLVEHRAVLLAHALANRRELDRAEEEAVEHELEHAPVLLALGERRRERLAEVLLRRPADLAEHCERVEQL